MRKKIVILTLVALMVIPLGLIAQELGERVVTEKALVESKPKAFYYEIKPYQPIAVILGSERYILDEKSYRSQAEKAVGRSTFMADPHLLREPVSLNDFYNLDRENIPIQTAPYQERGISEWEIQILDARGSTFRTLIGSGSLPDVIRWDGRGEDPSQVMAVGDVYSYIIILEMRDGSQMRKIGRPIDINGLSYENIVAVKESQIITYDQVVPEKIARYYQYVLNQFKENGYSSIHIKASNNFLAEIAMNYLNDRLYHTDISYQEVPEYARVEFIFQ